MKVLIVFLAVCMMVWTASPVIACGGHGPDKPGCVDPVPPIGPPCPDEPDCVKPNPPKCPDPPVEPPAPDVPDFVLSGGGSASPFADRATVDNDGKKKYTEGDLAVAGWAGAATVLGAWPVALAGLFLWNGERK